MDKIKSLFELATIFFKTLVKLFEALEVGTDEEGKATYYEYLNVVHDGAKEILDSKDLEKLAE